jgi:hypothetical protein
MSDDSGPRRPYRRRLNSPRVTIHISAETIRNSTMRESSHCMIAEAIKAQVPNTQNVTVDLSSIRWTDPKAGLRYVYLTPRNAQVALMYFDIGVEPRPFDIVLARASQIGNAQRRSGDGAKKPAKPRAAERTTSPFNADGSPRVQSQGTSVPTVIGGRMPPIGNLSKMRRFGIRQFLA